MTFPSIITFYLCFFASVNSLFYSFLSNFPLGFFFFSPTGYSTGCQLFPHTMLLILVLVFYPVSQLGTETFPEGAQVH